jgi:hypothetical protein
MLNSTAMTTQFTLPPQQIFGPQTCIESGAKTNGANEGLQNEPTKSEAYYDIDELMEKAPGGNPEAASLQDRPFLSCSFSTPSETLQMRAPTVLPQEAPAPHTKTPGRSSIMKRAAPDAGNFGRETPASKRHMTRVEHGGSLDATRVRKGRSETPEDDHDEELY